MELINKFHKHYVKSSLYNDWSLQHPAVVAIDPSKSNLATHTFFYQFSLLCKRNLLNIIRLPETSYVKVLVLVVTAVFCILLFMKSEHDQQGIQNI